MSPVDYAPSVTAPGYTAFVANEHDDDNLTNGVCRALYLGVAGDVTIITPNNDTVQFTNLAAGIVHPIMAKRVKDTGTDASLSIVCLY